MRTENIYSVYVHKNLKNDKYYVGMTSKEPKERWDSGWGYHKNSQMWSDIRNSDWNKDWLHGILGKFTDKNKALKYEAFLIAMLNSAKEGYNISTFSSNPSEDTKRKISESMTGQYNGRQTPVLQFSKDGEFIAEYQSIAEAERCFGCNHIWDCCKGKRKSCGGYIWKYKNGGLN